MPHTIQSNIRFDPAFINYVAGSTFNYSAVFDMRGYESIACALNLGTITTAADCPLYAEGSTSATGTFVSYYGSTAAFTVAGASGDIWLISEVYRPKKRYVRFTAGRVTANSVINGGLMMRWRANTLPVDDSTSNSTGGVGWLQDYALCSVGTSS